jgi:NAD dependent epimerase/dehydratase family enzyme
MPAPAFAIRLVLGEMADALILNGQRVLPAKSAAHGFQFMYPDLESALRQLYG